MSIFQIKLIFVEQLKGNYNVNQQSQTNVWLHQQTEKIPLKFFEHRQWEK